jgi:hypothetical protein
MGHLALLYSVDTKSKKFCLHWHPKSSHMRHLRDNLQPSPTCSLSCSTKNSASSGPYQSNKIHPPVFLISPPQPQKACRIELHWVPLFFFEGAMLEIVLEIKMKKSDDKGPGWPELQPVNSYHNNLDAVKEGTRRR